MTQYTRSVETSYRKDGGALANNSGDYEADSQVGARVKDKQMAIGFGRVRQPCDTEFAYTQHRDAERDPAQARLRRAHDPDRDGDHQQIPRDHVMRPLPEKRAAEIAPEREAAGSPAVRGGVLAAEVREIQGSHLRG